MKHELKVGDVVRCVDASDSGGLLNSGAEYTLRHRYQSLTLRDGSLAPGWTVDGMPNAWGEYRFTLLRRPVSAESPLCVGWYGLLRDGRRTDGPVRKNDTASGVDFPFCCEVDGETTVRCADGTYWHHRQNSPVDIIAIIPPEAVEKADEGPRYSLPPNWNVEYLGRWHEYDLWYEPDIDATFTPNADFTGRDTEAAHEAIRRAKAKGLIADEKADEKADKSEPCECDKLRAEIAELEAEVERLQETLQGSYQERANWRERYKKQLATIAELETENRRLQGHIALVKRCMRDLEMADCGTKARLLFPSHGG